MTPESAGKMRVAGLKIKNPKASEGVLLED
jgi:hypothetical protein